MIGENNLWVVERQHGTGRRAGDVQALNPTDPAVFVNCGCLEPCCKLIPGPLLQFAILHKFDSGIRCKCLADKVAVTGCMSPEVQFNSISWTVLCLAFGWDK